MWSNNETTQSISNLTAGIYTVTVTDANGCTTQSNYEVTQPEQVSVIPSGADVNCFGGADGSIQLNVSGGVGSYSYLWNNGATTSSLSGISASTYTVTVTDANGCTAQANYEVKQPSEHLAMEALLLILPVELHPILIFGIPEPQRNQ